MKYLLVLFFLFSPFHLLSMQRHGKQLMRALATPQPHVARAARPVRVSSHRPFSSTAQHETPESQTDADKKELEQLQFLKKCMVYARPPLTIAGIATIHKCALYCGMSHAEVVATLMAFGTANAGAFYHADEHLSKRMKTLKKKIGDID